MLSGSEILFSWCSCFKLFFPISLVLESRGQKRVFFFPCALLFQNWQNNLISFLLKDASFPWPAHMSSECSAWLSTIISIHQGQENPWEFHSPTPFQYLPKSPRRFCTATCSAASVGLCTRILKPHPCLSHIRPAERASGGAGWEAVRTPLQITALISATVSRGCLASCCFTCPSSRGCQLLRPWGYTISIHMSETASGNSLMLSLYSRALVFCVCCQHYSSRV